MRHQQSFFCFWVVIGAVSSALLASDPESTPDPRGRPEKFDQGKAALCALWHDDGEWNIRITAKNKKKKEVQRFTGSVRLDAGKIVSGKFDGLENAAKPKNVDWIFRHKDGKGFDFHFVSTGRVDSLSFKVSDEATKLTFELTNGGDDNPKRILIGKKGKNPDKVPFQLPAHPDREP